MGCSVRELLLRFDSRELTEWMIFHDMEPWGAEPADLRAGIVASTIANVNRDHKKRSQPYKPEDFMPRRTPAESEEQTPADHLRIIELYNAALGGEDLRKK